MVNIRIEKNETFFTAMTILLSGNALFYVTLADYVFHHELT